jgi:hypothetical protein
MLRAALRIAAAAAVVVAVGFPLSVAAWVALALIGF